MSLPLTGRTAVVTGVSRRRGIGFAVASRLASMGASLFVHHFSPHDAEQPWGDDDLDAVLAELRSQLTEGARLAAASIVLASDDGGSRPVAGPGAAPGHPDPPLCQH